jgi:hypothetical protein
MQTFQLRGAHKRCLSHSGWPVHCTKTSHTLTSIAAITTAGAFVIKYLDYVITGLLLLCAVAVGWMIFFPV